MLNSLLLIAQEKAANPELVLTTSEKLVAAVAMVAFCASFVTVVKCALRWQNGEVVIPVAKRRCLHVPTPVSVIGVIVVAFLASAAMTISFDELLAVDGEPLQADPNAELAEPDAEAKSEQEPEATAEELVDKQGNAEDLAWKMITGIVSSNGVLLFLFGTLIWLTQADGPGRSVPVSEPQQDNLELASVIVSTHQANADLESSQEVTSAVVHERWNVWSELKFAGFAFLMALVPTIATRLIVVSLMPEPKSHPFIEMMDGGGLSVQLLVLLMLIATIVAPVVEELLYRVVVLGGLANRRGTKMAIVVSAVLFSCAHGFPDCISLLPLAIVLGYTYVQRRSYRTVMLVHLMFNAFNMCLALLQTVG
ncbi:MAG: CPBP family intramembrane glutamic endopeptidase [Fuerstiella sp.]